MTSALELEGIRKTFEGFVALDGANLMVQPGEVHALLGENGAGKSSLMNVAAGLYQPEAGRVRVHGVERRFSGPLAAAACRIGMVHQHYKLVKPLSVAENILLALPGRGFRRGLRYVHAALEEQARALGFEVDPARRIDSLSVAEQQRVEILKAMIGGADILILDEPTAVLTDQESTQLLDTIRVLASRGAAIVLVTHKLHDVISHADRVTVMRRGCTVATCDPRLSSLRGLTELVVGAAPPAVARTARRRGGVRLAVRDLRCARPDGHVSVAHLNLSVHAGEIYGIAGVAGNGQGELVEALLGLTPPEAGEIVIEGGGDVSRAPPRRRRDLGIAAITADRQTHGLAGALSVVDNYGISQLAHGRFGSWAWVNAARMRRRAAAAVAGCEVQGVRKLSQPAALLSGGNAQKLVLAREFADPPRLVIAHSPSRGLDVRACADVQRRLLEASAAGAAVLLVSEDLEEVLTLADRIGVMNRGRIVEEFDAPADRQQVGAAMVGHA